MEARKRRICGSAVAALSLVLLVGVVPGEAQEIVLQSSFEDRLYAVAADSGRFLVGEQGHEVSVLSSGGLQPSSFAALREGWALAGSRAVGQGGRALVLFRGGEGEAQEVPLPEQFSRLCTWPSMVVDRGRLAGLVWLEGRDQANLGVRASAWDGRRFGPSRWVSSPGQGSQLALSTAALADGSWLVVWSAFDGGDDEILSSQRIGEVWTQPLRVHVGNSVPDITPVVTATARGAVAAWSRYDGEHYRLRLSRFRNGEWIRERSLGGDGSVFPFFVGDGLGNKTLLVYPTLGDGIWTVTEIGRRGQVIASSHWPQKTRRRPLVREDSEQRPTLEWLPDGPLSSRGIRR